jgi:hypothetical protein
VSPGRLLRAGKVGLAREVRQQKVKAQGSVQGRSSPIDYNVPATTNPRPRHHTLHHRSRNIT